MELRDELLAIEQAGWDALVAGTGRAHYRTVLAPDAVVVGLGPGIAEGERALDVLSGQTWAWVRLRAPRVVPLGDDAAVLVTRVIARRDFDVEHQALVASTYRRRDEGWELALVQHTPV